LVPDHDRDAERREAGGVAAFGKVAALHLVAEVVQHLGDAAHADAADADKMDEAEPLGQRSHAARSSPFAGASSSINAARRSAASSRAKRREAAAASVNTLGSVSRAMRRAVRMSTANRVCSIAQPPPAAV